MARFFVYIANHFAGKTFPKTLKTIRKRHLNRRSGSTFANDFTYKLFNHFNSWTIIWPSISVSALIVHVKCASAIIDLNNSLFVKCNPFEITFDRLSQQVGIRYFCRSTRVPAMWYQRQMSNKTRDIFVDGDIQTPKFVLNLCYEFKSPLLRGDHLTFLWQ